MMEQSAREVWGQLDKPIHHIKNIGYFVTVSALDHSCGLNASEVLFYTVHQLHMIVELRF